MWKCGNPFLTDSGRLKVLLKRLMNDFHIGDVAHHVLGSHHVVPEHDALGLAGHRYDQPYELSQELIVNGSYGNDKRQRRLSR